MKTDRPFVKGRNPAGPEEGRIRTPAMGPAPHRRPVLSGMLIAGLALVLSVGLNIRPASASLIMLDDFESYDDETIIATTTAPSVEDSPWGRFGTAVITNPQVFDGEGDGGSQGARLGLSHTGANATMLYFFGAWDEGSWVQGQEDISATPVLLVQLRVDSVIAGTVARARFDYDLDEAGHTAWTTSTTEQQTLENTGFLLFTFNLVEAEMTRTTGTGAFDLTQVNRIGIRFDTPGSGTQNVFIDDFALIPEPSSMGLAVTGLLVFGLYRRFRTAA